MSNGQMVKRPAGTEGMSRLPLCKLYLVPEMIEKAVMGHRDMRDIRASAKA